MRAAFYECDITPPLGGYMWGHYKKELAEDVLEKLYAKAVVVESDGEFAAIVAVDTCIIPAEMHEIVTKRIYDYTGIEPERVCIHSNHTHKGAPVSDSPEINCYADAAYKDVFFRLAADAVILAYKRLGDEEVTVKFGKIEVPGVAFNRTGILEDGSIVTHIRGRRDVKKTLGGTDPDLSVIAFEKEGKTVGAIINFALHQDGTQGGIGYTGDFSSVMANTLKEYYGNNFVSLFVLGACGDINHSNPDLSVVYPKNEYQLIGKKMAAAVCEVITDAEQVEGCVGVITEKVEIKRRIADAEFMNKKLSEMVQKPVRLRNFLFYHSSNEAEYSELYIQAIKIGDVCVYALPGELFVQIGLDIKANSPFTNNIVVENCNSYCGYVPTKEGFAEKSILYEASLCYHSNLIPEACDILTKKALEIGNRLLQEEI